MNRLAIIGCETSGKTVLTASLADCFQPGNGRFSCIMVPENTAAHKFFEYTHYQMRVRHAWPQATNPDRVAVMKWSFRVNDSVVADLETIDFGGEVFRSAFREGEPTANGLAAQDEMLAYLSTSSFIVVTVSLGVLVRDGEQASGMNPVDIARDSESKWVTRGLIDFVRNRMPPETGLVIALTQADLYREELEKHGGPAGVFRKSWPTIAALYPDLPVISVSAVSEVSEDGTPADGYSSAGVLPIMQAFTDYCVGGLDAFRESLESSLETVRRAPDDMEPLLYRQSVQACSEQVAIFHSASALSGDAYGEELSGYQKRLDLLEKDAAEKIHRMEVAAQKRREAEEKERREKEAAERAALEKKRQEEKEEEMMRRKEAAKRLEDERICAEKALEKSRLEAEVEFEKTRALVKRSRSRAIVALVSLLAVMSVCGLYYFVDNSVRRAELESMKIREMQKTAFENRLQKLAGSAHSGDIESARRIVEMLERNEMQESDVCGLYKIYMMLVNDGDAKSMFRLGRACYNGTCGVKKSDFNAHWFLSMAKRGGYASAELDALLEKTSAADKDSTSQSEAIDKLFSNCATGAVVNADIREGR